MVFRTMGVARGSVTRTVQCEQCSCEFDYTLKRMGLGSGRLGLLSASGAAERDLESALRKAEALVPCPGCGHYQQHMVRRQRRSWLLLAVVLAGLAGVFYLLFNALVMGADLDDKKIILTIRFWFLLVAIVGAGVSAIMVFLDDPRRFPFMKALHRTRGEMLSPGDSPQQLSAAPTATAATPSDGVKVDADFFLNRDAGTAGHQPVGKVTVRCDHCGKSYTIPANQQGRSAKCKCGMTFRT
jgi:hypothetical protein